MIPWNVLVWIVVLNLTLSGVHYLLGKIKDKTESRIDNGAYDIVSAVLKVLEWLMMNRGPK